MKAQLEQIRRAAKEALASFDSAEQLEKARIQYLGKKGELTAILKQMGKLSAEERPVIGQLANEIRKDIEDTIANKSAEIKKAAQEKRLAEETLDVTMPGRRSATSTRCPSFWTKSRTSLWAWALTLPRVRRWSTTTTTLRH